MKTPIFLCAALIASMTFWFGNPLYEDFFAPRDKFVAPIALNVSFYEKNKTVERFELKLRRNHNLMLYLVDTSGREFYPKNVDINGLVKIYDHTGTAIIEKNLEMKYDFAGKPKPILSFSYKKLGINEPSKIEVSGLKIDFNGNEQITDMENSLSVLFFLKGQKVFFH